MIFSSLLRSDAASTLVPRKGRHRVHRTVRARSSPRPRTAATAPPPTDAPAEPRTGAPVERPADAPSPAPARTSVKPAAAKPAAPAKVRIAKRRAGRTLVLVLMVAIVAAAAGAWRPYALLQDESVRVRSLEAQLAQAEAELQASSSTTASQSQDLSSLQARLEQAQADLAAAKDAKVRTVVEEQVVTKEVLRWVPSGEDVSVEITGFDGLIGVKDVHLTHGYGYTNLVGIAINQSDIEITYAQLGCTFLDAEGKVVANAMTNKQGWMPGQSWGFTCSAQTDATGGIVRVDEMS